ncbi:MAG: hypothetical protein V4669_02610 [Pseudomonadota bacterium]
MSDFETLPAEPPYAAAQREVQRRLGRCLIRLQQYERLLKSMLAYRELDGDPAQLRAVVKARMTAIKTLGPLIEEFTKNALQLNSQGPRKAAPKRKASDKARIRMTQTIAVSPENHKVICAQLAELLALRNHLVHHFVAASDLWSESGCAQAASYLEESFRAIDAHYLSLREMSTAANALLAELSHQLTDELTQAESISSTSQQPLRRYDA